MKIFEKTSLEYYFQLKKQKVLKELNLNTGKLVNDKNDYKARYTSKSLVIDTESLYFTKTEKGSIDEDIYFPNAFAKIQTVRMEGYITTGIFNYSGDINIIKYNTQNLSLSSLTDFYYVQERLNSAGIRFCINEKLKEESSKIKDNSLIKAKFWEKHSSILSGVNELNKNLEVLNQELNDFIDKKIDEHNEMYKSVKELNDLLEVKLEKKPVYQEKLEVLSLKIDRYEYILSSSDYDKINTIIFDLGSSFENFPMTFKKLSEEEIRDVLIACLGTHYVNRVGAEVFVKKGKTDIYVSTDSKVNYISECKIWGGLQVFKDSIIQLLGYSTWKNPKVTILIFSKNKNFKNVLDVIENEVSNYLNYKKNKNNVWTFELVKNGFTFLIQTQIFNYYDN
jgi:hypothetical protein